MNFKLFDLYSDFLLSSFAATTATGMSALMEKAVSHDQVTHVTQSEHEDALVPTDARHRKPVAGQRDTSGS